MKKFSALMVSALLVLSLAVSAQNSVPFKVDAGKFNEEYTAGGNTAINTKVMSNFNRMFAGASNVIWTKDRNVDRVYFETKGKVTRAAFNQKGQFLYSITTYSEESLPKNILLMVKDRYYGKHIFGVTEVAALGKTAYLITLDDKTSWLQIKVLDDEMTEEKVFLKAN